MIGNNRIFHLKNGTASVTNSQSDPTMNPLHAQIHAHQNNCGAVLADACMNPFTRPWLRPSTSEGQQRLSTFAEVMLANG